MDTAYTQVHLNAEGYVHCTSPAKQFVATNRAVINTDEITTAFRKLLPDRLADLTDIALAVYVTDRLVRRRVQSRDSERLYWQRKLRLQIPVRDFDFWGDDNITRELCVLLALFTEDDWQFEFVSRQDYKLRQDFLFPNPLNTVATVALFSGGLDSLAGLSHEIQLHPENTFVLFCAGTSNRTMHIQRQLAQGISERVDNQIIPVVVPLGLRQRARRAFDQDEPTQRSRGFVFQILGAVTAIMAGLNELTVYENGIGAINLPYIETQLGTHGTRATDPRALAAVSEFISLVVGKQFRVLLPFVYFTKAQLCESIRALNVPNLIRQTISCDGFPQRTRNKPQCGVCTSCLLRRQALFASGLAGYDSSGYVHDVVSTYPAIPLAKLFPLRVMIDQVVRLQCALGEEDTWSILRREYSQHLPEIAECLVGADKSPEGVEHELMELFRHYCSEWQDFPYTQ